MGLKAVSVVNSGGGGGGSGVTFTDGITTVANATQLSVTGGTIGGSSPNATLTITASGAVDSVSNSDGTLTILPTTGNVVASLNLSHANTWAALQQFNDGNFALKGATSGTITLKAAATAGTNTLTFPAGTTDFSATGGTSQVVLQTTSGGAFTVAQLAASDLSNGTTGSGAVVLASGATTVNLVVGTQSQGDNSTKAASTAYVDTAVSDKLSTTLTNTHIFVGNVSNVATDVAMSGDATIASNGTLTIANNAITTVKINNNAVTFGKIQTSVANTLLGFDGSGNAADITLTTTGSSGPATISGSVLNIPQSTGGVGGGGTNLGLVYAIAAGNLIF